jgi:hypothetical protein
MRPRANTQFETRPGCSIPERIFPGAQPVSHLGRGNTARPCVVARLTAGCNASPAGDDGAARAVHTEPYPLLPQRRHILREPTDLGIRFLDKGHHDIRPRPRPARDCSQRDKQRAPATAFEPGPAFTAAAPADGRHGAHRRRRGCGRGARSLASACAASGRGPRPTGGRPQCPVSPRPDWRWGGIPPRQPAASRRQAVPPHLSYPLSPRFEHVPLPPRQTPPRRCLGSDDRPSGPALMVNLLPASRSPRSSQEPVRAPHPRSAIRAHGDHVAAGRRARGRRIAYLGVSATTLPMRCSPIDATWSGRSHGAQPRSRLPVQARSHAARRRFRIDLRCHRPRCGASRLSAARRLSPGTSPRGARTVPSRRNRGSRRPDNDVVTPTAGSLHSGQSGLDHP